MTGLVLDETVCYSILSGIVVLVGAIWVLWGTGWLRRIELNSIAVPSVRALGLVFRPEGWGPVVRAHGTLSGQGVELRWRAARLTGRVRVHARVGGGADWVEVPTDRVESEVRSLSLPS